MAAPGQPQLAQPAQPQLGNDAVQAQREKSDVVRALFKALQTLRRQFDASEQRCKVAEIAAIESERRRKVAEAAAVDSERKNAACVANRQAVLAALSVNVLPIYDYLEQWHRRHPRSLEEEDRVAGSASVARPVAPSL